MFLRIGCGRVGDMSSLFLIGAGERRGRFVAVGLRGCPSSSTADVFAMI